MGLVLPFLLNFASVALAAELGHMLDLGEEHVIFFKPFATCEVVEVYHRIRAEKDMKGIGIGPAGGLSMSSTLGTKVTLAGRTAFLHNDDVPFVMQKLTTG